jgi:MFS family permease
MPLTNEQPIAPPVHAPYPTPAVAWYATFILAFMYWVSILDRFVISLLVDPIKHDLGITDVQVGMLQGLAFALTFSVFGLILGTLADQLSRRWVIFAGVSIWSLATSACGVAQNFWQLMLARVGVGVGEATLTPCATSMLSDLFPRERLTTAVAVYSMGSTVGSGCAFIFGGVIVDLVSHTDAIVVPLLGALRSWQAVFMIVGIPGMLLAFLIFTVPEPARRGQLARRVTGISWSKKYRELISFIGSRRRFFTYHYIAFGFAAATIAGCGAWYPAHMSRTFGWSATKIGLTLGITMSLVGILSQAICGRIVDSMFARGVRDAQFRFYAIALIIGAPMGIIATTSANPWIFLGGIGVFLLLVSAINACAVTSLNLITPNELRGTGVAFWSATSGLVGTVFGPIFIALASQSLFHGNASIGFGMATLIGFSCPVASLSLMLGLRPMREAVAEAERWTAA